MPKSRSMSRLRRAVEADLDWILSQEARPDFAAFIFRWPRERHARNLADPEKGYLIAEDAEGAPIGYAILSGLHSRARSIELERMAVGEPGNGVGRAMLQGIVDLAFGGLGANRLWLDVFDDNERARRAYMSAGFVEEGTLREAALRETGELGNLVVMSILARERPAATDAPSGAEGSEGPPA